MTNVTLQQNVYWFWYNSHQHSVWYSALRTAYAHILRRLIAVRMLSNSNLELSYRKRKLKFLTVTETMKSGTFYTSKIPGTYPKKALSQNYFFIYPQYMYFFIPLRDLQIKIKIKIKKHQKSGVKQVQKKYSSDWQLQE